MRIWIKLPATLSQYREELCPRFSLDLDKPWSIYHHSTIWPSYPRFNRFSKCSVHENKKYFDDKHRTCWNSAFFNTDGNSPASKVMVKIGKFSLQTHIFRAYIRQMDGFPIWILEEIWLCWLAVYWPFAEGRLVNLILMINFQYTRSVGGELLRVAVLTASLYVKPQGLIDLMQNGWL